MDHRDIWKEIELQDCPICGGPALLEEENGWCWYVTCADCGSHTVKSPYKTEADALSAAQQAADLWNMGKVVKEQRAE